MLISVRWNEREYPLKPVAVVAQGGAAAAMARRLLACDEETLANLQGVCGPGLLGILGREEALPWVDGALYLGREPGAPHLLIPTWLQPSAPLEALAERLLAHVQLPPPFAVLPEEKTVFSFNPARAIDRATLQQWLETQI